MSLLDKYRRGSYKGVNFDTFTIGRKENKKNTVHQYANSNRRYIEERGVEEPDFNVVLSIFGSDDYIDKRDALRKVLKSEGAGLLVLPLEGEFNVKCIEFNDTQNIIDNMGRCDFNVTFCSVQEDEKNGNPVTVKNSKISLGDTSQSIRNKMSSVVNNNFIVTNAVSYAKILDKLTNYVNMMNGVAGKLSNASLSSLISNFATNLPSFLGGNSQLLGSAINTLFYTFESVSNVANVLLSSSETFFDFGDTDDTVSPNTPQRIEQNTNNQLINTQIQLNAVAIACDAFANTDFKNEEELKREEEIISAELTKLEKSATLANSKLTGIEDVYYIVKQMQVDFADVVAEKEAITPKITTVNAKGESVTLLAYQYYDSIDNVDDLIELNNIQDPKKLKGEVRIFTDV